MKKSRETAAVEAPDNHVKEDKHMKMDQSNRRRDFRNEKPPSPTSVASAAVPRKDHTTAATATGAIMQSAKPSSAKRRLLLDGEAASTPWPKRSKTVLVDEPNNNNNNLRKENKSLRSQLAKLQKEQGEQQTQNQALQKELDKVKQQLADHKEKDRQKKYERFRQEHVTRSSRKPTLTFDISHAEYDRWLDIEVPTKCSGGHTSAKRCARGKKLATMVKAAFDAEASGKTTTTNNSKKRDPTWLLKRAVITMDSDTGYEKAVLSDEFVLEHLNDILPDGVELTSMKCCADAVEAFCNEQANTGSTHDDDLTGFLLVLRGRKVGRIAKPQKILKTLGKGLTRTDGGSKDTPSFYKQEAFGNHAKADIWEEVELKAGEGVIIPRRWVHAFKSDPDTVALSFKLKRVC